MESKACLEAMPLSRNDARRCSASRMGMVFSWKDQTAIIIFLIGKVRWKNA